MTWNNTQPSNATAWNYIYSTAPPSGRLRVRPRAEQQRRHDHHRHPRLHHRRPLLQHEQRQDRRAGRGPDTGPAGDRSSRRWPDRVPKGGSVGVLGDNITSAAVAGGCSTNIGGATQTCSLPGDPFYVDSVQAFQPITAPTADFGNSATSYYATASPGPKHPCVTAASPSNLPATTFESVGSLVADASAAAFNLTGHELPVQDVRATTLRAAPRSASSRGTPPRTC